MSDAHDVRVRFTGDVSDLQRAFTTAERRVDDFEKRTQRLSASLTRAGKALTLGVTAPILGLAAVVTKAASDMGESMNAVRVVFGDAGKAVTDFAKTAAAETGLSAVEINNAATTIGAQLQNVGISAEGAAQQAINLTKRAADMASVFNTDVNSALDAIKSGLRGELDPLEKFGVGLSAVAVKAHAVESGLIAAGEEMTDQQKVVARLGLLFEQTAGTAGDFVNTSDSLANSTRILKADLANAAAELGQQLLPIATELVGKLRELLERFTALDPGTKKIIVVMAGLAAALGPVLLIAGKVGPAILAIKTAMLAAAGPVGLIAGAVAVLAVGVIKLITAVRRYNDEQELMDRALEGTLTTVEEVAAAEAVLAEQQTRVNKLIQQEIDARNDAIAENERFAASVGEGHPAIERAENDIRQAYVDTAKSIAENLTPTVERLGRIEAALAGQRELFAARDEAEAQAEIDRSNARIKAQAEQIALELQGITIAETVGEIRMGLNAAELSRIAAIQKAREEAAESENALLQRTLDRYFANLEARKDADEKAAAESLLLAQQTEAAKVSIADAGASLIRDIGRLVAQGAEDDAKKRFKIEQEFGIVTTIVETAIAVAKALASSGPPGFNFIQAGLVAAAGAVQTALIAGQKPPALAEGGIVLPRPGGTIAQLGEGGSAEAVIPLNDESMSRLSDRIVEAMDRAGGAAEQSTIDLTVQLGDRELFRALAKANRDGRFLIDQRRGLAARR